MLRVLLEPLFEPVAPRDRGRDELERLLQPVVRLGAAESQEARARLAEAFAAEAGDAELVVGPFSRYSASPWLVMPSLLQTGATFGKT